MVPESDRFISSVEHDIPRVSENNESSYTQYSYHHKIQTNSLPSPVPTPLPLSFYFLKVLRRTIRHTNVVQKAGFRMNVLTGNVYTPKRHEIKMVLAYN